MSPINLVRHPHWTLRAISANGDMAWAVSDDTHDQAYIPPDLIRSMDRDLVIGAGFRAPMFHTKEGKATPWQISAPVVWDADLIGSMKAENMGDAVRQFLEQIEELVDGLYAALGVEPPEGDEEEGWG